MAVERGRSGTVHEIVLRYWGEPTHRRGTSASGTLIIVPRSILLQTMAWRPFNKYIRLLFCNVFQYKSNGYSYILPQKVSVEVLGGFAYVQRAHVMILQESQLVLHLIVLDAGSWTCL